MFHLLPLSRREVEGRPDLPLPWEAARTPAAAAAERFAYGALWETFLRGGYPEPSTYPDALMSFKDRVASDLAQHLAHVGEPIRGPAEQLRSLTDVHRGVACHSADRKLELTDLLGNGPEVSRSTWRRAVEAVSVGVVMTSPTDSIHARSTLALNSAKV